MHTAFLQGDRLYLRDVQVSDVNANYYHWMNDIEATQYLESRFFPHSLEGLKAYVENLQTDRTQVFLAIVLMEGHRHIGNIKLGPIDWFHRRAEIGILVGEKDCWGKGYATEAIGVITRYAFQRLNLHKLTAGCYSNNVGSVKAFEKAGYHCEGTCKEHYFCDGKYVDRIVLGRINDT